MPQSSSAGSPATAPPSSLPSILRDLERGEHPLTLNAARRESCVSRNGRSPSLPTVYRWVERGELESCNVGGQTCTTRSALLRFASRGSAHASTRDTTDRQRAI